VFGGWEITPLYHYEYGSPMSFYSNSCPTATDVPQFREGCIPGLETGQIVQPHGRNGYNPNSGIPYLNINALETNFSTFGYTGQGKAVTTPYGPDFWDLDFSLTKSVSIAEKARVKISENFYNAFNSHFFIGGQSRDFGAPSFAFVNDVSNSTFGQWNGTVTTPRTIQMASTSGVLRPPESEH
jgi:hypothetical protein